MTHPANLWRVGVDTGGTFTDLVMSGPEGTLTAKTLSTPDNPATAVFDGLKLVLERAEARWPHLFATHPRKGWLSRIQVVHGSTVATNALLEGKHGRTALVTTAGFEDVLSIARQNRPHLYALSVQKPPPPIARKHTLGLKERVLFDGSIQQALSEESMTSAIATLREWQVESVALCLLHSYANPFHEQQFAERVRAELPEVFLTVSHELLPEFREYERTSTCAVNALVAPAMNRYLRELQATLASGLRIMASAGGTSSVEAVCESPVQTILSGPAGGVRATEGWSELSEEPRLISFDMGGTSTDVSLCEEGVTLSSETVVGHLPVRLPMLSIHTVGAGGGSIAWLDQGGALRVGPQSAGAFPGPAAYGRQQEASIPTVTDAHVVLGRLPAQVRLGGRLPLHIEAAKQALSTLARPLGLSLEATAEGVLQVADATMVRAIQKISVHQGYDPREFALMPFGGAGGLHACRLAEQLGMKKILLSPMHGVLSAAGMLMAPPSWSVSQALMLRVDADSHEGFREHSIIRQAISSLEQRLQQQVMEEGFDWPNSVSTTSFDLRFVGQSYELRIPVGSVPVLQLFKERHRRLYGSLPDAKQVEVVNVRMDAQVSLSSFVPEAPEKGEQVLRPIAHVSVSSRSTWEEWPVFERGEVRAGSVLKGPAILVEESATTVVEHGWSGQCSPQGAFLLRKEEE
jgi:N-methylhydantoinase A